MNGMTAYQSKVKQISKGTQHMPVDETPCHQEVTVITKDMEYCPFCGFFFRKD